MATGKLPNEVLERIINKYIRNTRKEVILGSKMGMDTAQIDFGDNICVVSTDPITGAANLIGGLSIDVSVNDVITSGADPIGVLLTILCPEKASYQEIENIMKDAANRANELNLEIIGGHTEITTAVTRFVITTTVIGILPKERRQRIGNIRIGDKVFITKSIGIEGTAILAHDRTAYLSCYLSPDELAQAKGYQSKLSVLAEGSLASSLGVDYMHDVTEGGLLGAIYETHQAIEKGIRIYLDKVPVTRLTQKVADAFHINVMSLISSGSLILIARDEKLINDQFKANQLEVTCIGQVEGNHPVLVLADGSQQIIPAPQKDQLYIALERK